MIPRTAAVVFMALWCLFGFLAGRASVRCVFIRYIVIDERPPHTHVGVGWCEEEARMAVLLSRAKVLDEGRKGK